MRIPGLMRDVDPDGAAGGGGMTGGQPGQGRNPRRAGPALRRSAVGIFAFVPEIPAHAGGQSPQPEVADRGTVAGVGRRERRRGRASASPIPKGPDLTSDPFCLSIDSPIQLRKESAPSSFQ